MFQQFGSQFSKLRAMDCDDFELERLERLELLEPGRGIVDAG
jgi:hypothetical protein